MTPEERDALRKPFPPEAIGKLPRVTCKVCSDKTRECDRHKKAECKVCGNWISTQHIHLDFVGHAATTDRLLQCDPDWTWEPVAADANGAPVITNGGLWIRMTVCGVTRYGWGDGPDIKQMISDAIRNAAMRFGVALDLWSKEDLHAIQQDAEANLDVRAADTIAQRAPAAASATSPAGTDFEHPAAANGGEDSSPTASPPTSPPPSANKAAEIKARVSALIAAKKSVNAKRTEWNLPKVDDSDAAQLELWDEMLCEMERELVGAKT